jgi:signal transduction histidine kinase
MSLINKIKPVFWDDPRTTKDSHLRLFDYVRAWKYTLLGAAGISLLPLIIIFLINQYEYETAFKGEMMRPIHSFVLNTQRSISSFLSERQSALYFIAEDNKVEELSDQKRLIKILANLRAAFGEFVDLSLIDSRGVEKAYAGPGNLPGKSDGNRNWFKEVIRKGAYVGGMFRGFGNSPHFVIAVRHREDNGDSYILRASINVESLEDLIRSLMVRPFFDAFIINHKGVLQTPSRYYGKVFEQLSHPFTSASPKTDVQEFEDDKGHPVILGLAPIEGTPFRFVTVAPREAFMKKRFSPSGHFVALLIGSMVLVLIVIFFVVTHLVGRIFVADRRRVTVLHHIQYTNRMASIGRLSAGVAHEINNPLAIINEKAGLLKDLISFKKEFSRQKILQIVNSILFSVKRCSTITHRLLGFARHIEVRFQTIYLEQILREVLAFLRKESEYRNISINLEVVGNFPSIESDLGQLEQIFLNIINNAFAAVDDGGKIDIELFTDGPETVSVRITDDGCGISEENQKHIFDPFFSTKGEGGTGLGLSITYGIAQKLGGKLDVESKEGEGSSFTVTLPIKRGQLPISNKEERIEGITGR